MLHVKASRQIYFPAIACLVFVMLLSIQCSGAPFQIYNETIPITTTPQLTMATPPPYLYIEFKSDPSGAQLWIDRKLRGTTPVTAYFNDIGDHEIRLSLSGYVDYNETIRITRSGEKFVQLPQAGSTNIPPNLPVTTPTQTILGLTVLQAVIIIVIIALSCIIVGPDYKTQYGEIVAQKKVHTIWIERITDYISLPYPIIGINTAVIIGEIFFIFSFVVNFFGSEKFHHIIVISSAILIGVQLTGITYLLKNIDQMFKKITPGIYEKTCADDLYSRWTDRFYHCKWYYMLSVLVILPSALQLYFGGFGYYGREHTMWSILFDIFSMGVWFFILYLLSITIWIMVNLVWLLQDIESSTFQPNMHLDILAVDGVGGLKPIQDVIIQTLVFYFVCITIAILSNVNPFVFLSFESFFLIILLAAGLGVFLFMIQIIRLLIRGRIETEINKIDEAYKAQQQKLIDVTSGTKSRIRAEVINLIKSSLDTLQTQRERMLELYNQSKGYDLVTLVKFGSSFILSVIAFIQTVWDFASKFKIF